MRAGLRVGWRPVRRFPSVRTVSPAVVSAPL